MGDKNSFDVQQALDDKMALFERQQKKKQAVEKEDDYLPGILTRCTSCHKMFKSTGMAKMCPSCTELEKNRYSEIRDYLYLHPGTAIEVLCDRFNVSREIIKKYLKEYKLEIAGEEKSFFLVCERCREPIKTGRFCEKCEPLMDKKGISQYDSSADIKFRTKLK